MNLEIRSHRTCLSPKVRRHVERQVERSVGGVQGDIRVWLSERDADSARPGTACRLLLVRPGRNPVLASASNHDLFAAVDAAFERLSRRAQRWQEPRWARRMSRRRGLGAAQVSA